MAERQAHPNADNWRLPWGVHSGDPGKLGR